MLQTVEGIVVDVGWYRTTIRSFEREIFNIPNSVFSRNVVLNVTRKGKEWRFYEFIGAGSLLYSALSLCAVVSTSLQSTAIAVLHGRQWADAFPKPCVCIVSTLLSYRSICVSCKHMWLLHICMSS